MARRSARSPGATVSRGRQAARQQPNLTPYLLSLARKPSTFARDRSTSARKPGAVARKPETPTCKAESIEARRCRASHARVRLLRASP